MGGQPQGPLCSSTFAMPGLAKELHQLPAAAAAGHLRKFEICMYQKRLTAIFNLEVSLVEKK